MIAHNDRVASLLVVAGFAVWLTSGRIFGSGAESSIIGSAAFFIVACFLPETRRVTFLSRRSSLGLVGLFVWLAEIQFFMLQTSSAVETENSMVRATLSVAVPIASGVSVYWLSIFLIRGLRAKPEYESGDSEAAPSDHP